MQPKYPEEHWEFWFVLFNFSLSCQSLFPRKIVSENVMWVLSFLDPLLKSSVCQLLLWYQDEVYCIWFQCLGHPPWLKDIPTIFLSLSCHFEGHSMYSVLLYTSHVAEWRAALWLLCADHDTSAPVPLSTDQSPAGGPLYAFPHTAFASLVA